MKISKTWLKEWVATDLSSQALADILTMAGLEVDAIETAAPAFNNVIVGEILEATRHPKADKLQVCQVNNGKETLQIICGAANARAGLKVALAQDGAILPPKDKDSEPFAIKISKIREVESFGMLCSSSELGLSKASDGIIELPQDAPVGENIRDYLSLDDEVIELDITPNRADCFSIQGVTREISSLTDSQWTPVNIETIPPAIDDTLPIEIQAKTACSRYVGRVIQNIDNSKPSPLWLQERLRRSGIRSINPVVDITNYILIELGQPMHAFDLNKLNQGIIVRYANENEKIKLLDEQELTLSTEDLVIADHEKPLALAGIMGGLDSSVTPETTAIFLESAFFNPIELAGRARSHGLHTDSSHRFERGVDFKNTALAIERACKLLQTLVGGAVGPVIDIEITETYPKREAIVLEKNTITRVLGIDFSSQEIEKYLQQLHLEIDPIDENIWKLIPPSYRYDLVIAEDLVEEIARLYGYNNIPKTHPTITANMQPESETQLKLETIKNTLVNKGYQEVITYSFIDETWQALFSPNAISIPVANPISSEMSVMRSSLWPGLIKTAQYNLNRQQHRMRLFETGLIFSLENNEIKQVPVLAGIATGEFLPKQWAEKSRQIDFFDIKNDVEGVINLTQQKNIRVVKQQHPALHPGQSAAIIKDTQVIGWIGMLHPQLQNQLDIVQSIFCFSINLLELTQTQLAKFIELSRFPMIQRDIAMVVAEEIEAEQIQRCIIDVAPDVIQKVTLFDLYQGQGIEEGQKSLAFNIILQTLSHTFTDEEIEAVMQKVITTLKDQFKAQLRS